MAVENRNHPKRAFRNLFGLTRRLPSRFVKDETGSVTIEFVLWVPVFVLILAITVDASILFLAQANLWSIARDTTRRMSTGQYLGAGEASTFAHNRMPGWGTEAVVTSSSDADFVRVGITIPISAVSPFNIVGSFTSGDISIALSQHREPR